MVETTIKIKGETVELKYPNTAVQKIDKKLGYSAMHLLEKANKVGTMAAFSLDDIATVIWGGMLHKKPGLQLDQVVNMLPLRINEFAPYAEKVFEIIMEIYGLDGEATVTPDDDAEEVDPGNSQKAPSSGTGSESSA